MADLELVNAGDRNWASKQNANLTALNNAKQEIATLDEDVTAIFDDPDSALRVQTNAAIADGVAPVAADAAMKLGVFYLNRRDLDSMSGSPVEAMLNNGSTYVPVWQFPDGSASSVGGVVTGLPESCVGVKVEAILGAASDASGSNGTIRIVGSSLTPGSVFGAGQWLDKPVVAPLPVASSTKQQILEAFLPVDDPTLPLAIRVTREGSDQWDSWGSTINLVAVKVTPLTAPIAPVEVQEADGQNTWPFLLSVGSKLICFYSKGVQHGQPDTTRKAVARVSTDSGATWGAQYTVLDRAGEDDSVVGCGVDASGDPLLWFRSDGTHRLYRSTDDGATFAYVSTPTLSVTPNQLGPIMNIPTVGLVSFWNGDTPNRAWGIVKSADDGATWTQVTVESNLAVKDTPTEIAGVYLGSGKILAIGRNELGDSTTDDAFLQLTSSNYGSTWSRNRSNILDTYKSTPSMIYDSATDLVHLYYYRRLWGQVRRRVVDPDTIWSSPRKWPEASVVAHGWSRSNQNAGNVHAALHGDVHKVAFYSGDETDTSIQVSTVEV